ncbi:MAG: tRNA (adenosine(37)-N6)-threonylcarbamoyltransferase complex ATPase subunit type 1 TsaE, partial [Thermodesulfovibrionales bacterium]
MKILSNSPDETKEIGFRLGRLLKAGDIVGLYGDLGAGKTTMVKGIAKAVGIDEKEIVSASFTIIAEYETDPPFIHIDLYRIEHGAELDDLGIRSITGGGSIAVIEWAEKARGELRKDIIKVGLQTRDEQTREISIEGLDEKDRSEE